MSKINLTPPEFTVTVGGLDITSLVQQFSLRQGAIDIRRPIIWEGTMAIAKTKTWTGESLDDFENPSRWARGKHPVVLTIAGSRFATLRIASYAYNEDTDSAQIELSQLLGLLDYKTPPEDYRFIETECRNVTVEETATKLLTAAGLTNYQLTNVPNAEIPAPDRTNRSYIELAQEILGERRCWLYHDEDEVIRLVRLDFAKTKSFERNRGQLVEFNRQPNRGDIVPNVYRVTGGGEKLQDECSFAASINQTEEIYGTLPGQVTADFNPIRGLTNIRTGPSQRIVQERIVTELSKNEPGVIETKKTGYKFLLVPTENQDGTLNLQKKVRRLFKIYEIFETRYYDEEGRLIKEIYRKNGTPVGNLGYFEPFGLGRTREDFEELYRFKENLELNIVEYGYDPTQFSGYSGYTSPNATDKNVLRIKITTNAETVVVTKRTVLEGTPIGESFDYNLYLKEKVVETWTEKCAGNEESSFIYRKKVFRASNASTITESELDNINIGELFLRSSLSQEDFDATPPSWQTRPPLCPRVQSKLNIEVRRRYPGANDDLIDKREFEITTQSVTTRAEGQQLADMLADLTVGRAFGYEAVLSLREATQYIVDPTPLQVAWFHNRALLLDAPSIVFDGKEAEVAWEAPAISVLSPSVGNGTPVASDIFGRESPFDLTMDIRLNFFAGAFNAVDAPDLSLISVDANGDVVTVNGFVQASANQNQFAQILVAANGSVVVDQELGNIVSSANDAYGGTVWDPVVTVDGEVATMDGEVLWFA